MATKKKTTAEKSATQAKTQATKARTEATKAKAAAAKARVEAAKAKAEAARAQASLLTGGHAEGFMNFVRQQGVVGLAVGLAIGTAAGASVKQIVEGFINPLINLLVGSQEGLMAATWTVNIGGREAVFGWGAVVSSLITLIATALVIYFVVKVAKLDRLDKPKDK